MPTATYKYRVRRGWFGKSILQVWVQWGNSEYSGWQDAPFSKAPRVLIPALPDREVMYWSDVANLSQLEKDTNDHD